MGAQDFPHDRIRREHDRSSTLALVEALVSPDVPEARRVEITRTLAHLSDPRSLVPLRRVLFDRRGPAPLREAAAEALRDMDMDPTPTDAELRTLWASGDAVLRRHALAQMEQAQADLVEPVAADPEDPLHLDAIETLTFGFAHPRSVELRIAALSHHDPAVRFAAADALLFDEPIAAGPALLAAVLDPDPKVVDQVLMVLEYYPNRAVLRGLHDHPDDAPLHDAVCNVFDFLRDQFLRELRSSGFSPGLREWMEPVWDILAFTAEELAARAQDPPPERELVRRSVPTAEVLAACADPDFDWHSNDNVLTWAFSSHDWMRVAPEDQQRLRDALLGHADPMARALAATACAAWGDAPALQVLCQDPVGSVRKAAVYRLGQLPADASLSAFAWRLLVDGPACGMMACEALDSYLVHADRVEAVPRLGLLAAASDRTDDLRLRAIWQLTKWGEVAALRELLLLLLEPPRMTWSLHKALLDAAWEHELPLPAGAVQVLREVDHLEIQAALSRLNQ